MNVLQELIHFCITKVVEAVEEENVVMIVMEYAAGRGLFDQVNQENKPEGC